MIIFIKPALLHLILHHTASQTATFSGNNYISYRIRNPNIVRTLRQQQSDPSSIYRTAQNIISFSLAVKEDSGTILQLGDPISSTEYALLEVCSYSILCSCTCIILNEVYDNYVVICVLLPGPAGCCRSSSMSLQPWRWRSHLGDKIHQHQ